MELTKEVLDNIELKFPPSWKILFYEFISDALTLSEFGEKMYGSFELEHILGEELYIELVSFNYTVKHKYRAIVEFIMDKILVDESEEDCRFFVLFREFYLSDIKEKARDANSLIEVIVRIFDGAHIKYRWNDTRSPVGDIKFLSNESSAAIEPAAQLTARETYIGGSVNCGASVSIVDNGVVYFFIDVSGLMYRGGGFLDAMKKLIFYRDCGKPAGKWG